MAELDPGLSVTVGDVGLAAATQPATTQESAAVAAIPRLVTSGV